MTPATRQASLLPLVQSCTAVAGQLAALRDALDVETTQIPGHVAAFEAAARDVRDAKRIIENTAERLKEIGLSGN